MRASKSVLRRVLRGSKRAEKKEHGAGTQQGVARGGIGRGGRILAVEQNDFADGDLVAGLQGLLGHAHSIYIGSGGAAAVGEAIPACRRAHHAVFRGNARFLQADVS